MVRLAGLGERRIDQLSGGQQQRVALARAVVLEPEVLLLDEPMAALDRKLREEMRVEVKNLQERLGTTFVFVTHDQEEALAMSDRIAVMNHGRVEQVGAPEEIYERPRTRFVAEFLAVRNLLPATVEPWRAAGPPCARAAALAFRPSDDGGYRAGATVWVGVRPERMRLDGASGEQPPGRRVWRTRSTSATAREWRVRVGEDAAHRGGGGRRRTSGAAGTRSTVAFPPDAVLRLEETERDRSMSSRPAAALLLALPCLLVLAAAVPRRPRSLMFEASLGRRSAYGGVVHDWSLANYLRALEPLYLAHPRAQRRPRPRHDRCSASSLGLSGGVLAGPTRARALAQRAARAGDPALLDELPRAHVRLDVPAAHARGS